LVTAVKRVPSSTALVSGSVTADAGALVPQIVSGTAALAVDTVSNAALVAAIARVVTRAAAARETLGLVLRACLG
jgi:hypothetical protein